MKDLLQSLLSEIHAFYDSIPYRWGYEFLYNTGEACRTETKILLLTINPKADPKKKYPIPETPWHTAEHAFWAPGNEFKIRKQLHGLFHELNQALALGGHNQCSDAQLDAREFAVKHVIAASAVPYRTVGAGDISTEMWMFSRYLWRRILDAWEPRLIVAVGHEAYDFMGQILGCAYRAEKEHSLPAHVQTVHNTWIQFQRPDENRITLAGFPHFARFPAFSENAGQYSASCDFLRELCRNIDVGE